jgi:hypothetical protein
MRIEIDNASAQKFAHMAFAPEMAYRPGSTPCNDRVGDRFQAATAAPVR